MKKIAILLLCIVILLSGCAGTAKPEDALPAGDVWEIIEEAYIYAFPRVLMDATKTSARIRRSLSPARRLSISSCTAWRLPTRSSKTW